LILNPSIIALISGSIFLSFYAVYASVIGIQIINWWDIRSGSERQLSLERKTYLVSMVLAYVMGFEIFSLFLFTYTADSIHTLFVGAMCAAGSLNVNTYGYPALLLKMANVVLCGIWLILNYIDNRAYDYPLIKEKYELLVGLSMLLVLETIVQLKYFMNLKADVITSCCGTLFSEDAKTIAGEIAHFPTYIAKIVFFISVVLTLRVGIHFYVTGKAANLFSGLSTWLFFFSLVSVISFISLYFYELPTHHCPFCLLQKDYHYIGYPLYISLFGAGITGAGVGMINRFKDTASLKMIIPSAQKKLCLASIICYVIFVFISVYPMISTDFILES